MFAKCSQYWLILLFLIPAVFLFDPVLVFLQCLLMASLLPFFKTTKLVDSGVSRALLGGAFCFFLIFLFARFIPFLSSAHPLGYDTGIYRFEIWSSLQALPQYVSGLFLGLPLMTDVAGLFGMSVDQILYGGYFLLQVLLFLSLWVFLRKRWGIEAAFFGVFLLLISTVQWKAYSMLLYKQYFALSLVLYSFFLIWKRSFWVLLVLGFLALLQPLDAFFLGVSLLLYFPFACFRSPEEKKYFSVLILMSSLSALLLGVVEMDFWTRAWQIFSQGVFGGDALETHLQQGIFLSLADYGYQAAIVFVLGLLGAFFSFKNEGLRVFHIYGLLMLFWIALGFFFYQRLLIQLDLVMIVFGAYSLALFYHSFARDLFSQASFLFLSLLLALPLFLQIYQYQPFFLNEDQQEIASFCSSLDKGVSLIASESFSSPWVRGWCLEQNVSGPGLFANRWDRREWELFWGEGDLEEVRLLLEEYERPLYFYSVQKELRKRFFPELFEIVADGWYRVREE